MARTGGVVKSSLISLNAYCWFWAYMNGMSFLRKSKIGWISLVKFGINLLNWFARPQNWWTCLSRGTGYSCIAFSLFDDGMYVSFLTTYPRYSISGTAMIHFFLLILWGPADYLVVFCYFLHLNVKFLWFFNQIWMR